MLSQGQFWFFLALSIAAAIGGFFFAFRLLGKARLIEDTPTAKIRSAHQGYVELNGTANPTANEPEIAPLTGTACCWYRYRIEKRGDKSWHTVDKGTSEQLFLLQDPTGICLIDPEGAEVTPGEKDVWHGSDRHPGRLRPTHSNRTNPSVLTDLLGRLNMKVEIGSNRYRYTEERIHVDDQVYAIGLFKSLDDLDHASNRSEIIRDLLHSWKQDHQALLARFDRDGDGEIDLDEWDDARREATREAARIHQQQQQKTHLHTLSDTGSRRLPFLISTLPEFNLVSRYRWLGRGALAAFFIGGGITVLMLGAKLGG
ncbi:MAG: hypothetical protein GY934_14770, partial [Gammaproteobacteria bacterium]|nr:hypothetical protein [Gammaproteobacteria bacterium]